MADDTLYSGQIAALDQFRSNSMLYTDNTKYVLCFGDKEVAVLHGRDREYRQNALRRITYLDNETYPWSHVDSAGINGPRTDEHSANFSDRLNAFNTQIEFMDLRNDILIAVESDESMEGSAPATYFPKTEYATMLDLPGGGTFMHGLMDDAIIHECRPTFTVSKDRTEWLTVGDRRFKLGGAPSGSVSYSYLLSLFWGPNDMILGKKIPGMAQSPKTTDGWEIFYFGQSDREDPEWDGLYGILGGWMSGVGMNRDIDKETRDMMYDFLLVGDRQSDLEVVSQYSAGFVYDIFPVGSCAVDVTGNIFISWLTKYAGVYNRLITAAGDVDPVPIAFGDFNGSNDLIPTEKITPAFYPVAPL